jgi:hypothetical protein
MVLGVQALDVATRELGAELAGPHRFPVESGRNEL